MRRGIQMLLAVSLLGGGLLAISVQLATPGSTTQVRPGGVFRISLQGLDYIDPALSYNTTAWSLIDTTCARLMTYPDKRPPEGYRLVPEVAIRAPSVSRDGKTWTFTLRSGFRFSNGDPVRASAFARAIARTLAPGVESPGAEYTREIVGAEDVQAGRTALPAGVVARGNRLVVRFKRPVPDFPARTTMPFFCAVPPALPADPEGVSAFPGAGPYYVADYRPGQSLTIRRNRYYAGGRPHYVDGFVADLGIASSRAILDRIERGEADWGLAARQDYFDPERRLVAKYGLNRTQFFVKPGLSQVSFSLNNSRPLFRDNPRLRRAVNFAVDRRALVLANGSPLFARTTDQFLPRGLPGFNDARIYPLTAPDLSRARALASGRTRGGKAVLYTIDMPSTLARAQLFSQQLAKIGLDVQVKGIPGPAYLVRLYSRDEPYDIAFHAWGPDYLDPFTYINTLLDGRLIGTSNAARFNSAKYNALMRRAAVLRGAARYRAYGQLDVKLARDAAPSVPLFALNESTLVSKRVGCVVLRPTIDLTAVCLKR
jgi:peptide/nickel transport system substrate-binding protein